MATKYDLYRALCAAAEKLSDLVEAEEKRTAAPVLSDAEVETERNTIRMFAGRDHHADLQMKSPKERAASKPLKWFDPIALVPHPDGGGRYIKAVPNDFRGMSRLQVLEAIGTAPGARNIIRRTTLPNWPHVDVVDDEEWGWVEHVADGGKTLQRQANNTAARGANPSALGPMLSHDPLRRKAQLARIENERLKAELAEARAAK